MFVVNTLAHQLSNSELGHESVLGQLKLSYMHQDINAARFVLAAIEAIKPLVVEHYRLTGACPTI